MYTSDVGCRLYFIKVIHCRVRVAIGFKVRFRLVQEIDHGVVVAAEHAS